MASPKSVSNHLLAALPSRERRAVLAHCGASEITYGEIINEPGERVRHVYFPISGIISIQVTVDGNDSLEVGMIGNEGFYGGSLAFGVSRSPLRASVQCSGQVFRMRAAEFENLLDGSPELRKGVHRYLNVLVTQLAQTAYCTCYHLLEARVARWLLMTHDRAQTDRFRLTHELLAEMLGVRRSGVSIAAAALQERHLISYNRGVVTVVNRAGLEAAACECYRHVEGLFAAAAS